MTEICHIYTKRRREFGGRPELEDSPTCLLSSIDPVCYASRSLADLARVRVTSPRHHRTATASGNQHLIRPAITTNLDSPSHASVAAAPSPRSPRVPNPAFTPRMVSFYGGSSFTFPDPPTATSSVRAPAASPPPEYCEFVESAVTTTNLDCIPLYAVSEVNTEPIVMSSVGCSHVDGAWPKEVDPRQIDSVVRYKRKIEKSPQYAEFVSRATANARETCALNNTVDIYERYFERHAMHTRPTRTRAMIQHTYEDPMRSTSRTHEKARAACCISWHAQKPKFAVAYCAHDRGMAVATDRSEAYIWDVSSPRTADSRLAASSPLVSLACHPHDVDLLVGGRFDGGVSLWDTRTGPRSTMDAAPDCGHRAAVRQIEWRTDDECVSMCADGTMFAWDRRRWEPLPFHDINSRATSSFAHDDAPLPSAATCFAVGHSSDHLLVGTVNGSICRLQPNAGDPPAPSARGTQYANQFATNTTFRAADCCSPIRAILRHPHLPESFLSLGDWRARIWCDDLSQPLVSTADRSSMSSAGCWSPTKPSVLLLAGEDGILDVHDLLRHAHEPVCQVRVSSSSLRSIRMSTQDSRLVALGDDNGRVTVVQLSDDLARCEATYMSDMSDLLQRQVRVRRWEEAGRRDLIKASVDPADSIRPPSRTSRRVYHFSTMSTSSAQSTALEYNQLTGVPLG